jgi:hypothetical protein
VEKVEGERIPSQAGQELQLSLHDPVNEPKCQVSSQAERKTDQLLLKPTFFEADPQSVDREKIDFRPRFHYYLEGGGTVNEPG